MSHVFSVSVSLTKWLRRKRKAYHKRKQRSVTSVDTLELIFKHRRKPLLRSQTVGSFSTESLSGLNLEDDNTNVDPSECDEKSDNQHQDTKTPFTPVPVNSGRSKLFHKGRSRFSKPAIRIDGADQMLESRDRKSSPTVNVEPTRGTQREHRLPAARQTDSKETKVFASSRSISEETIFENQQKVFENNSEIEPRLRRAWEDADNLKYKAGFGKKKSPERETVSTEILIKKHSHRSKTTQKWKPKSFGKIRHCSPKETVDGKGSKHDINIIDEDSAIKLHHGRNMRRQLSNSSESCHDRPVKTIFRKSRNVRSKRHPSRIKRNRASSERSSSSSPARTHHQRFTQESIENGTGQMKKVPTLLHNQEVVMKSSQSSRSFRTMVKSQNRHKKTRDGTSTGHRCTSPQGSRQASPIQNLPVSTVRGGKGRGHAPTSKSHLCVPDDRRRSHTPTRGSRPSSPIAITYDHLCELRKTLNSLNLRKAPSTSASSRRSTSSKRPRGTSTSSQRSSSTSRASSPENRLSHNALGVPRPRTWATRRRSPSSSRPGESRRWHSPASSRAPSCAESSDDWDSSDYGSPPRRGRSSRRRRKSFSGFKPKFTHSSWDYRDIVYPKIPDVEPGFEPLVRFRRAVKSVQVLLRATDRSRNTAQITAPSTLSWVQIHNELEMNKKSRAEQGLLFDPSDYKAKKELQLTSEAKAILSMEPSKRTAEQLHVALVALNQSVEAFSEFPLKMQESLVRVGFFENFEANRVIIRQGHFADNFYLLLNGLAVVTILETDRHTGEPHVRTAAFLKKGNSFGELALMHGAFRSATVTCKEPVELLAVGRQDFIDVFMHVEKDREPEHIQFLRGLDTFRGWPIDELPYDNPKICLFTYFRKGVLLCKDSCKSDWVYIIKTGTCKVLKQLTIAKQDNPTQKFSGHKKWLHSKTFASRSNSGQKKQQNSAKSNKNGKVGKSKRRLPWVRDRGDDELKISSEKHLHTLEQIYSNKHPEPETLSDDLNETFDTGRTIGYSYPDDSDVTSGREPGFESSPEQGRTSTESSRIYTDRTEQSRTVPSANSCQTSSEPSTVFVQVTRLGPKDVFGLEEPVLSALSPVTSVSLVSDGAECVLINRKFYLQHLTDVELKRLRLAIQPYPATEDLERKLRDKKNWEDYKTMALNDHLAFTRYVQDTLSLYY